MISSPEEMIVIGKLGLEMNELFDLFSKVDSISLKPGPKVWLVLPNNSFH